MNKILLVMSVLSLIALGGCQQKGEKGSKSVGSSKSADSALKTEDHKTLYAIGHMFGGRLKNLSLKEAEVKAIMMGLEDSALGKKAQIDLLQYQKKIQEFFQTRMAKSTEKVKVKGDEFLANFLAKEGGKKTESGLAYKVIRPGKGKKPGPTDTVEVHYHGTLINGEVFDSSVQRGKTISFPLNRVIRGWQEGLQLIGEGGKIKLVIPSKLGYGDHGAPPKIPGGATLVFEVELFKVITAKAGSKKKSKKSKK